MKNLKDENARNEGAQNKNSQNKNPRNENARNEIDQKENQNTDNKTNKSSENFKISGNWADQSKDLKSKYSQLTDEDLKVESGKENEMIKRMEKRLNKNRDEVIDIIQKGQSKSV